MLENMQALSIAMQADLDKWERKALAKGADISFESEFIPPDVMAAIRGALASASGAEEVKAAFAAPFPEATWESYP